MRFALAASAALSLVGFAAPAVTQSTTEPIACPAHPAAEQRQLAARVFAHRNWRSPEPGPGRVRQMRKLRSCAPRSALPAMRRAWREGKRRLYQYAVLRRVAPYRGFEGEGLWLTWLPIPRWIVYRETREHNPPLCSDGTRWSCTNPKSGACGPEQLNGWTSCSYGTVRDKLRITRVAHRLWNGGAGASNWNAG